MVTADADRGAGAIGRKGTIYPTAAQFTANGSFSLLHSSDIGYGEQETVFPPLTVSFRR